MIREVSGVAAEVRWGYHLAATLGDWRITRAEGSGVLTLSARILSHQTAWLSQQPLVFEARHTKGVWRWSLMSLQHADGWLTATVHPQKEMSRVQPHATA
jgi:hypothetical protein